MRERDQSYQRALGRILIGILCLLLPGCALHQIRYDPSTKNKAEKTQRAVAIKGDLREAGRLLEQAQLPHHSPADREELQRQSFDAVLGQLGSRDYILLGGISGRGNAYSNHDTLMRAICKRAADEGGDLVMIWQAGTYEQPFTYTTPGYATTNVTGTTHRAGNTTYGAAQAHTTYTPGTTVSGVMRFPNAAGLVFKHVPGQDARRARIRQLDDTRRQQVRSRIDQMTADRGLRVADVTRQIDELLDRAGSPPSALARGKPATVAPRPAPNTATGAPPSGPGSVEQMLTRIRASVVTIQTENGHASGFVITRDGRVLTAAHGVQDANVLRVKLDDGRELQARVEQVHQPSDTALLTLPRGLYQPAPVGSSTTVGIGADVYAIGAPEFTELGQSVSRGIVSGVRRVNGRRYLQSDVAINPGNSGGPLVSKDGRVIGIASWQVRDSAGLGFFVPVEDALAALGVSASAP